MLIERDRLRDRLEQSSADTTKLFCPVSAIMTEEQWSDLGNGANRALTAQLLTSACQ